MNLSFLTFLAEPWFVVPWYAIGALGAAWVAHDEATANTQLKTAIRWAWPIIVFFFSVIGLALYFATARPPRIGTKHGDEKMEAHREYEAHEWRRVNGAVIHCVAGDGLGIMTAMVIARATGMSFWQEFWFEYAVGFGFGWFIFQLKSMTMMTESLPKALAMAFRAELFSMATVMGGMGAVMTYVTPMVVTSQPKPLTFAFWGFGMLGLLVGYAFTLPMNWMLLKIGWKHGMGPAEGARAAEPPYRPVLLTAMILLGLAALAVPAWLTETRESMPCRAGVDAAQVTGPTDSPATETIVSAAGATIDSAIRAIRAHDHAAAGLSLDEALRASDVGAHGAPRAGFVTARKEIREARRAIQLGHADGAIVHLDAASESLVPDAALVPSAQQDLHGYVGAMVIDAGGAIVGEVRRVSGDTLDIALGGARDVWGWLDLGAAAEVNVPSRSVVLGPERAVGRTMVMLPSAAVCRR